MFPSGATPTRSSPRSSLVFKPTPCASMPAIRVLPNGSRSPCARSPELPDSNSFSRAFPKASNTMSKPLRSRHFNIRVLDLPGVKNVRVTYRYPEWTRMQNVVEERGGDLRAVEGTQADLEVQTDRPLRDGVLVLDNEQQIRLSGGEGNVYKGTVR